MDTLEAVRRQTERRPRARGLSGLLAVTHQLAAPRDRVVWMSKRLGGEPVRSVDAIRSRLEIQHCPQIEDHEGIAGVQPSFELARGDASLQKMTKEVPPSRGLECEVGDECGGDD